VAKFTSTVVMNLVTRIVGGNLKHLLKKTAYKN
jgi:hypothetical protein